MNTEKVRIVEQTHISVTNKVETISEEGIKVSANVTDQNGTVTSIDRLRAEEDGQVFFEGYANPNISGSFYSSGNETEVMEALVDFVNAVRNN